jgi:hypothetical protein
LVRAGRIHRSLLNSDKLLAIGPRRCQDARKTSEETMPTSAPALPLPSGQPARPPWLPAKIIGFSILLVLAFWFVAHYALRYLLHFNEAEFTNPNVGAANYWQERFWLVSHLGGGMLALLLGPWQFWTGFRMRYAKLHRWTGRLFLLGVVLGCIGAVRLIATTTFGWGFGASLASLALAWLVTAGVAYVAILRGRVDIHKIWMVRAYVVTFAFVTFRALNDYGPLSHLEPANDRAINLGWACWAIPLLLTIAIQELLAIRKRSHI